LAEDTKIVAPESISFDLKITLQNERKKAGMTQKELAAALV